MNSKTTFIVIFLFLALSFAIGYTALPYLPDNAANHWNAQGEADGFTSKNNLVLTSPILLTALSLLLMLIPKIDPRRENIEKFRKEYNIFVAFFAFFMFYIHALSIALNLGVNFNMTQGMVPIFAALNFILAFLCSKAQPNWFVGIRTPWTLSSDNVWEKTHALGNKLFTISGILTLIGIILPAISFYLMVAPVIATAVILVFYSYITFNDEKKVS